MGRGGRRQPTQERDPGALLGAVERRQAEGKGNGRISAARTAAEKWSESGAVAARSFIDFFSRFINEPRGRSV